MKKCSKCLKIKSIEEFNLNDNYCKYCRREYMKSYMKKDYENHPEKRKSYMKKYRENNLDKMLLIERCSKKRNKATIKKYYQTPKNRIMRNLRSRISISLKQNIKSIETTKLIGCPIDFLKNYLQSLFQDGMTWENYGRNGWHIDHIRPCASFDLSDPEQQKICFHYTNMQPLWAKDNLIKSNKT